MIRTNASTTLAFDTLTLSMETGWKGKDLFILWSSGFWISMICTIYWLWQTGHPIHDFLALEYGIATTSMLLVVSYPFRSSCATASLKIVHVNSEECHSVSFRGQKAAAPLTNTHMGAWWTTSRGNSKSTLCRTQETVVQR